MLATRLYAAVYYVDGEFSQASSPVLFSGETTPYQVADFRHCTLAALERHIREAVRESGGDPRKIAADIEAAVEAADYAAEWNSEIVRLASDATPDPTDPAEWYATFGDYVIVDDGRPIEPQIITYEQASDDAEAAIREALPDLSDDDVESIVAMCEKVASAAESIEILHADVISAYEAGDIDRVVLALERASQEERRYGDDPDTQALADSILESV